MTRIMQRTFALLAALLLCASPLLAQTTVEYYHTDPIGSVRSITNESGGQVARYDYRLFGEMCVGGGFCTPVPGARQFAGKERDQETGLDYFGGRYYAASLGRFTTPDPAYVEGENIANPQLWNRYNYALNNPLRYEDPDGRLWETLWDAYNIAMGLASLRDNWNQGNWGGVALDGGGVILDGIAGIVPIVPGGAGTIIRASRVADRAADVGRAGRQDRLRELATDPNLGRADKGWINQEINSIERGNRTSIRNPPGKDLAHERGREAAKGYDYGYSNLQDRSLHRTQHRYDDFGRANRERPPQ